MLNPPPGLDPDHVADALARDWRVPVASMTYRPVGWGSHHWSVTAADGGRWWATVDELVGPDDADRLTASLSTARALRDAGLAFVVAPLSTVDGGVMAAVDTCAVSLYPHVEGQSFGWGAFASDAHRDAVRDLVVGVHTAPAAARRHARVDDFSVPFLDALSAPVPDAGPYSARVADLLGRHDAAVRRLVAGYTDLVAGASLDRAVLTHGEPHPGNTMLTAGGWRLIDWDTVLVAPPERDLWGLDPGDGSLLAAYAEATGVTPSASMLDLYRRRWTLADIAVDVARFGRPHAGDANDDESWKLLSAIVEGL